MGATCNGCGDCCDPVILPYSKFEAQTMHPMHRKELFTEREWRWLMEELEPMPRKEGLAKAPYLGAGVTYGRVAGQEIVLYSHFYRCSNFDVETRSCTSYHDRPEVCSEFPWYGAQPNPTKAISPRCSYNEDLGREVAVELTPRRVP